MIKTPKQNGFALLMAVILTSTLLLVVYSLSNISLKELTLSYAGRDSQVAFYAADTGVECAQYWDIRNPLGSAFANPSPSSSIDCNGNTITADSSVVDIVPQTSPATTAYFGHSDGTSLFQFCINGACNVNNNQYGPCAIVTVTKDLPLPSGYIKTTIESRGYNTCNTDSPQRFERGISVTY